MELPSGDQGEKAKLEDALLQLIYSKYRDVVFHGGTAIWRCYSGNRFSRDIDMYYDLKRGETRSSFYKSFLKFLRDSGFQVKSSNYDKTTDTMHAIVETSSKMKVDINFKYRPGIPVEYTNVDGTKIIILSLSPEDLLNEKMDAYEDKMHVDGDRLRQSEVQDLYDIYHLISLIERPSQSSVKRLSSLAKEIAKTPPPNAGSLQHLILSGLAPTVDVMLRRITEWIDENEKQKPK